MDSICVVTLNMLGLDSEPDRRMELIRRELNSLAPDVVALQEVCVAKRDGPNQAEVLAGALGYRWVWSRAKSAHGELGEGLAFLSRYPVRNHEATALPSAEGGRLLLMAAIDTPAGVLFCFDTHLDYGLARGTQREQQVLRLEEIVSAQHSELPKIVMGDFNATPEHDEIRFLRGRHTLGGRRAYFHDAFERGSEPGVDGTTWARRNPLTRRWRSLENDRRIDYVFVTPIADDGRGEVHSCQVVLDRPGTDGRFPSDHFAVMARVQLTPDADPATRSDR